MTTNKIPTDEVFQAWLGAGDFVPKYTKGHMQRQMSTLMRYEILDYLESAYSFGYSAGFAEGREKAAAYAETKWPRGSAHICASENADRYRALEDASEAIAKGIRRLRGGK